jgi:hypothetical protein
MSGDDEAVETVDEPVAGLDTESNDEGREVTVTGGESAAPVGVNWQVWVPVVLGLVSSLLSKLTFEAHVGPMLGLTSEWWLANGILLFSGDIFTFSLFVFSIKLYADWGSRVKFLLGGTLTVSLCLLGVVYLSVICWGFIILGWILVTVVWGQYRLSPPRTGIWLGFGGAVAIVLGYLLTFFIL